VGVSGKLAAGRTVVSNAADKLAVIKTAGSREVTKLAVVFNVIRLAMPTTATLNATRLAITAVSIAQRLAAALAAARLAAA